MQRLLILFFLSIAHLPVCAQHRVETLSFKDKMEPITEKNFFKTEGYYNWCPSIIRGTDGTFHLFYSRWKKMYGFGGWLTHSEIAHAVSTSPSGPWTYQETVLTGRGKGHWDAINAHNPKIEFFEGKYYLYYISTNMGSRSYTEKELIETAKEMYTHPIWKILRPNQRTGVAVANSLNGPWTRSEKPLIEPSGPITTLTVNPAIARGKDKRYYLVVKGDKPNEKRFIRNQAVAISDTPTGPFTIQPEPVIDYLDTEDMSIWYDARRDYFYGIFHSTEGFIGMVSSPDGIHWHKAHEYNIIPKTLQRTDGTSFKPQHMERPFVYVEDSEPRVLSVAVKDGDEAWLIFVPIKK